MIEIASINEDVVIDSVNAAENGDLGFKKFNRLSKRAEIRLMDFLTGDVEGIKPPTPYTDQKLKDILSPFITKFSAQVVNGIITRPENYYQYDSLVLLGNYLDESECDDENEVTEGCNTVIELLDSAQFDKRCRTFIEGLQPSFDKPIARMVGKTFEFMPTDLGSIKLQYIRYPIFGKIVPKFDNIYNEEVIDEALSTNYEYDEYARELLVFWITQEFAVGTREQALLQANIVEGKLARG